MSSADEGVKTSYNLPRFPPPPPRPSPRRRPIALPVLAPIPIPLPPNPRPINFSTPPPASVKKPFATGWAPSSKYRRSPLAPENVGAASGAPISRRYTRPPPTKAISACQAFAMPRMGEDEYHLSIFEDWVSKSLDRRIREKLSRSSRVGDKAGLGLHAGREMMIWATLRSSHEKRDRALKDQIGSPMSAPATQTTFPAFPTPPELSGHTTDAKLARSLGHRKTMSLTTFPSSVKSSISLPALGALRELVTRRSSTEVISSSVALEADMMRRIVQEHLEETRLVDDFAEDIKSEFDDSSESSEDEEDEVESVVDVQLGQAQRSPSPSATEIHLDTPRPLSYLDKPLPDIIIPSGLSPPESPNRGRSRSRSPPELPHPKRPAVLLRCVSDEPVPSIRPPPPARLSATPAPTLLRRTSGILGIPPGFQSRLPAPPRAPPTTTSSRESHSDLPTVAWPSTFAPLLTPKSGFMLPRPATPASLSISAARSSSVELADGVAPKRSRMWGW